MKKKLLYFLTFLFTFGLIGINQSYSQTLIERVPINFEVFIPCANNGIGETAIAENAELQFVTHVNEDENGGLHYKSHVQPHQNWDLIGLVTGVEYQANGLTGQTVQFTSNWEASSHTFYNNFRIIGPGPGNNYMTHVNTHVTFNANGEITVEAVNVNVTCN